MQPRSEEGIVPKVRKEMNEGKKQGKYKAIVISDCTEVPGYTNRLRNEFNIPVADADNLQRRGLPDSADMVVPFDNVSKSPQKVSTGIV